jgi:hypothetical protein
MTIKENDGRSEWKKWWVENKEICESEAWTPKMISADSFKAGWDTRQPEIDELKKKISSFKVILRTQEIPSEFEETFRKHFWDILA